MENLITQWAATMKKSNDLYLTNEPNTLPVVNEEENLSSDTEQIDEYSKEDYRNRDKKYVNYAHNSHQWDSSKPSYEDIIILWKLGYGVKDPETTKIIPVMSFDEWKSLSQENKELFHKSAIKELNKDEEPLGNGEGYVDYDRTDDNGKKVINNTALKGAISDYKYSQSGKKYYVTARVLWMKSKDKKGVTPEKFLVPPHFWKDVFQSEEDWVSNTEKDEVTTKADNYIHRRYDTKEDAVEFCKIKMMKLIQNLKKCELDVKLSDFKNLMEAGFIGNNKKTGAPEYENAIPSEFKKKGIDAIEGYALNLSLGDIHEEKKGRKPKNYEEKADTVTDVAFFEFIVYSSINGAVIPKHELVSIADMFDQWWVHVRKDGLEKEEKARIEELKKKMGMK